MVCWALAWAAPPVLAQNLEQLLDRHVETRGGSAAFQGFDTYRATGVVALNAEMHGGQEIRGDFVLEWQRPGKIRMQFSLLGNDYVQATDGSDGWSSATGAPQAMNADELAALRDYGDLVVGPLAAADEQGLELRLVGKTEVEGTEAFQIEATWADGRATTIFVEVVSALPMILRGDRLLHGNPVTMSRTVGDYKEIDGLLLPHYLAVANEAGIVLQTFSVHQIELGTEIASDRFTSPATSGTSR